MDINELYALKGSIVTEIEIKSEELKQVNTQLAQLLMKAKEKDKDASIQHKTV